MNDFDYENMQKKRIAKGAYAKKGGSRSKKCTLPGDYLTPAQKAKLSKTVAVVRMNEPITLETFKSSSTALKREYLERIRDQYNVGASNFSVEMWGKEKTYINKYISRYEPSLKDIFVKHRRQSREQRERWLRFCEGVPREEKTAPPEPEIPETSEPEIPETSEPEIPETSEPEPDTVTTAVAVRSGSFTVTGRADEALDLLRRMFLNDHHVGEFTLTFNYTKEETK